MKELGQTRDLLDFQSWIHICANMYYSSKKNNFILGLHLFKSLLMLIILLWMTQCNLVNANTMAFEAFYRYNYIIMDKSTRNKKGQHYLSL